LFFAELCRAFDQLDATISVFHGFSNVFPGHVQVPLLIASRQDGDAEEPRWILCRIIPEQ